MESKAILALPGLLLLPAAGTGHCSLLGLTRGVGRQCSLRHRGCGGLLALPEGLWACVGWRAAAGMGCPASRGEPGRWHCGCRGRAGGKGRVQELGILERGRTAGF